jgi:signal peptidase I
VSTQSEARSTAEDRAPEDSSTTSAGSYAGAHVSAGRWLWEWTKSLLVAFGLFLIIRTFLVEAFRIPTGSMEDTLLVGDFLLVNKAVFGAQIPGTKLRIPAIAQPKRGDVAVFVPPHEPDKNYVKRLIAGPGDTVEMREKALYVNGRPVPESYARYSDPADVYSQSMYWQCEHVITDESGNGCQPSRDSWGPLLVPPDRYMMLGDNRDDSEDSRYWGFVDRSAIKGKPLFIYFSFAPNPLRSMPWLTNIRWGRIGRTVH